jgi:cytochrome c55X
MVLAAAFFAGSGSIAGETAADYAAPASERQAELLHRVKHDCGSCHGLTLNGGLGPALLPGRLAERDSEELAEIILEGIKGTPMPPWKSELTQDEAQWIADLLKSGGAL